MIGIFAVALFGFLLSVSDAHAQNAQTPPSQFSQTHLDAARQHVSTLLLDTGVLSEVSLVAFNLVMPTLREAIRTTPFFASLSQQQQQAMFDYITNAGPIMQEEVMRGAPVLIDRFAPRFAAMFSEEELNDVTAFMRTEHGASTFLKNVLAGATGFPPTYTDDEMSALESFHETPGGRAFVSRSVEIGPLMRELGYSATSAPNVRARLQHDLCEIAGPECPTAWRTDL